MGRLHVRLVVPVHNAHHLPGGGSSPLGDVVRDVYAASVCALSSSCSRPRSRPSPTPPVATEAAGGRLRPPLRLSVARGAGLERLAARFRLTAVPRRRRRRQQKAQHPERQHQDLGGQAVAAERLEDDGLQQEQRDHGQRAEEREHLEGAHQPQRGAAQQPHGEVEEQAEVDGACQRDRHAEDDGVLARLHGLAPLHHVAG